MANENTQTHYQEEVFVLILHQILVTNLQRIVKQQEERINNQILVVKGLRRSVKLITRYVFYFPWIQRLLIKLLNMPMMWKTLRNWGS